MARILLVDDSSIMRRSIRTIVESAGHEAVEASDGRELLAAYINHKPDLVTLDISMVNVNGIDALQSLMRSFPGAKVVMVSAIGHKQQVLEAIKLGAKSYIVKPFEPDKLISTVNKVLGYAK